MPILGRKKVWVLCYTWWQHCHYYSLHANESHINYTNQSNQITACVALTTRVMSLKELDYSLDWKICLVIYIKTTY